MAKRTKTDRSDLPKCGYREFISDGKGSYRAATKEESNEAVWRLAEAAWRNPVLRKAAAEIARERAEAVGAVEKDAA